jgi:hypothetical protein
MSYTVLNTSCCICFEDLYVRKLNSTVLDCCNQCIHTDCLITWFIFKGKVTCPFCRNKSRCITVNDIIIHLNKIKNNFREYPTDGEPYVRQLYPNVLSFNYPKLNSLINDFDLPFVITIIDNDAKVEVETNFDTHVIDNKVYVIIFIIVLVLLLLIREILVDIDVDVI